MEMAALLNRRRAGSVILDDKILSSRPSDSRFLRISSAYPLGAVCLQEKLEYNNNRRNTFTSNNNVSIQPISKFPCFSVGPCQLENRSRETQSAKVKFIKLEDTGRHSNSAKISLKLRNITLSTRSLQIKCNDYQEDSKFLNNTKLQATSLGRSNHIDNIQKADEFQGNCEKNDPNAKNIVAHGKQLSPKNKKVCKRIKTSSKRNKSLHRSTRKPRHNSKKSCSKSGNSTHSREDTNTISPKDSLSVMSVVKVSQPYQSKTSPRSNKSRSLSSINSSVSSSPRRIKGDHSKSGQEDSPICSLDEIRQSRKDKSISCPPRVYLSEKQSRNIMGVPAVPPGTPGLESPEIVWIPSLSDVKSQRLISSKLAGLVLKQTKKENQEKLALEQKRIREEKQRIKEWQAKTKQRQRSEIYALNKILTEVENSNYEKFKLEKGLPV